MPLPDGTVTFLFTDIEGSTLLWEEYPEAMRIALARHDSILRTTIETHHGYVFKTVGDAFCAAFATASDALSAALASQRRLCSEQWGETGLLRVRMALHTGEAQKRDGDYFGPTLNRVARLQATGHGLQTLLSQTTYTLVRDTLPPDITTKDLGTHRLKDLQRPEQVFQLNHPDLPAVFPPIKSLDNPDLPNNLPQQVTSFIGREKEIEAIKSLLATAPLLTLTGSGGCGKTRLGLQVAAEVLENYPDGVWFVELAPLADPALVLQTVSGCMGLREETGKPLVQTLTEYLKSRDILLVLDNCEHVLTACAHLADTLLRACPHVRILASSREGLGIAGESLYSIPSLSLPDLKQAATPANLTTYEAVRLFVDRAIAVQPNFAVTNANAPALASICHRLDGIPLAIELSAARVRALSVEEINSKLDNRFRLLTGGSRAALPRQQTLRALIDWSYDLLNPQEKTLLRRISIFAGGWTMAAVEAVGAGESETGEGIEEWEVLDLLTILVDKSLVVTDLQEEHTRYHLLETIRQYARDRLAEENEVDFAHDRHTTFFRAFAVQASGTLRSSERAVSMRCFLEEQENLRAALEWNLQDQQAENVAHLAVAMKEFWEQSGAYREGADWFWRIIPIAEAHLDSDLLVEVLISGATLYWRLGEYSVSRFWLDKAVSLVRAGSNKAILGRTLTALANTLYYQGEFAASRPLYAECLELAKQFNPKSISASLNNLALVDMDVGEDASAQKLFEEALVIRRVQGNPHGIANVLGSLGELAARQGDFVRARLLLQEALGFLHKGTDKPLYSEIIRSLVPLEVQEGNLNAAYSLMIECLQIREEVDDKWAIAVGLEDAAILMATEQSAAACTLLAAAQRVRDTIGAPRTPVQERQRHHCDSLLRERLPADVFAQAWTYGSELNAAQAVEQAISVLNAQITSLEPL